MQIKGKVNSGRQVAAAVIGNALECYDFVIIGFLTSIISTVFFPAQSTYASLLLTTASFGVGFFMRPLGGVLIGIYANRKGRKAALQLIIAVSAMSTAAIAFTPSYAVLGAVSSVIIVVARLAAGFAIGGEFASGTAFLVESSPPAKRGFYGSWMGFGQALCMLMGAGVGALVTRTLSHDQLYDWGWRIPFILALMIVPVGYWIRRHVDEPVPDDREVGSRLDNGGKGAFRLFGRASLCGFFLSSSATIAAYVFMVYMPTFANKYLNLRLEDAFLAQCLALGIMVVSIPFFGALSDKIGRKMLLLLSCGLYSTMVLPLFGWLIASPSEFRLTLALVLPSIPVAIFLALYAPALAEQFTYKDRSLGLAICYNASSVVFGGFAQFFITWMLHVTGSLMTPAYYLLVGAVLGLAGSALLSKPERISVAASGTREALNTST